MKNKTINFVFFGGEPLAVPVLNKLKKVGLLPKLIVCNPDRPSGRGQKLTPPPVKIWAEAEKIEVFQPDTYRDEAVKLKLSTGDWDLFVVVAYNFILPEWLLTIPKHNVVNIHPSLLPKLRGASPIRTAILNNEPENIGITIMVMDKEMDHGDIIEQEPLFSSPSEWPVSGPELDSILANKGGKLLAEVIPQWVSGDLLPQEQNHDDATYCKRFEKANSELSINPHKLPAGKIAYEYWLTINAYAGIGDAFFIHNDKRIKVKKAEFTEGNSLKILRVVPEGKKETDFTDYLGSLS